MNSPNKNLRTACLLICVSLAGCAPASSNLNLVEGPAIIDVVTPFDAALTCLDGKVDKRLGFAVGNIPDGTGREAYDEGGVGKFVTQSAGDVVQSALFKTGVKVINRRDMGSAALEAQWGIRSLQSQQNAHFAITGSINSLDFIPGAGAFVNVGGIGARYSQNRILVGLDLAMTNVATGQIVSNIALKKQMVADDAGVFGTRFTNNKLIDADIGGARREALNDALRTMLQLATFELILQLMPPQKYEECMVLIDPRYGAIAGNKTAGEQYNAYRQRHEKQSDNLSAGSESTATQLTGTEASLPQSATTLKENRLAANSTAGDTSKANIENQSEVAQSESNLNQFKKKSYGKPES